MDETPKQVQENTCETIEITKDIVKWCEDLEREYILIKQKIRHDLLNHLNPNPDKVS